MASFFFSSNKISYAGCHIYNDRWREDIVRIYLRLLYISKKMETIGLFF